MGEHTASRAPVRKVKATGAAGAAVVILVWVARLAGLDVPPEVAGAATLLIAAGTGYLTTP